MVVWVVNDYDHDFSDAERFGRLIALSTGRVNVFQTHRLKKTFEARMENCQKDDYILLSGAQVLNVIAAMTMAKKVGCVNLLIYDAIRKEYVPRELDFGTELINEVD